MRSTIQIRGISPLLRGSLFLGLSGSRANLQSSICFPLIKVPFTQKLVRSITGHCPLYLPKVQFAQKASGINNRALLSHTLHTPVLIHQLYELDVRRNNYCMLHQHPRYPLLAPHNSIAHLTHSIEHLTGDARGVRAKAPWARPYSLSPL